MRISTLTYFLVFILAMANYSFSQEIELPREEMAVHLSQHCVASGDELWVSVYVSNAKDLPDAQISSLAFVELVDTENNSLVRKKVLLEKGIGTCSFVIPESINTGLCTLLTYTNWLKNFGENSFSESKLLVLNPEDTQQLGKSTKHNLVASEADAKTNAEISIRLAKTKFGARESVDFDVFAEGKAAANFNYSVSVTKKLTPQLSSLLGDNVKSETKRLSTGIKYLPDYKGLLLTGTLIDKTNNNPIANEDIILSRTGSSVNFDYCKTDDAGKFSFLLAAEEGEKDIVFNLPTEEAVIRLDESFVNGMTDIDKPDKIVFNNASLDFLRSFYVNKQLQSKFTPMQNSEAKVQKEVQNQNFYGEVYQQVVVKNFKALDSISEYFYELTPTVHFSRKQGKQNLYLTNPETNFSLGDNPAVFIDGVYYPDWNALAQLDYKLVDEINVIPKRYYYRDKVFDGIVSIFTHTKNIAGVALTNTMSRMIYPASDVASTFLPHNPQSNKRQPDLRNLLFWTSGVTLESKQNQKHRFYTSDVKGEYVISVVGVSANGKFVFVEKTILVE